MFVQIFLRTLTEKQKIMLTLKKYITVKTINIVVMKMFILILIIITV